MATDLGVDLMAKTAIQLEYTPKPTAEASSATPAIMAKLSQQAHTTDPTTESSQTSPTSETIVQQTNKHPTLNCSATAPSHSPALTSPLSQSASAYNKGTIVEADMEDVSNELTEMELLRRVCPLSISRSVVDDCGVHYGSTPCYLMRVCRRFAKGFPLCQNVSECGHAHLKLSCHEFMASGKCDGTSEYHLSCYSHNSATVAIRRELYRSMNGHMHSADIPNSQFKQPFTSEEKVLHDEICAEAEEFRQTVYPTWGSRNNVPIWKHVLDNGLGTATQKQILAKHTPSPNLEQSSEANLHMIHMDRIPSGMTYDELRLFFDMFGSICRITKKVGKGWAEIQFEAENSAWDIVGAMHNFPIGRSRMRVCLHEPIRHYWWRDDGHHQQHTDIHINPKFLHRFGAFPTYPGSKVYGLHDSQSALSYESSPAPYQQLGFPYLTQGQTFPHPAVTYPTHSGSYHQPALSYPMSMQKYNLTPTKYSDNTGDAASVGVEQHPMVHDTPKESEGISQIFHEALVRHKKRAYAAYVGKDKGAAEQAGLGQELTSSSLLNNPQTNEEPFIKKPRLHEEEIDNLIAEYNHSPLMPPHSASPALFSPTDDHSSRGENQPVPGGELAKSTHSTNDHQSRHI